VPSYRILTMGEEGHISTMLMKYLHRQRGHVKLYCLKFGCRIQDQPRL